MGRAHRIWDDFVVFITGGNPHGPPARPDTNKLAASIDAAPTSPQVQGGTNGALTVTQSQLATPTDSRLTQSFVNRINTRSFIANDALQILRLQAEQTNIQQQTHFAPAYPAGFKTYDGTEY